MKDYLQPLLDTSQKFRADFVLRDPAAQVSRDKEESLKNLKNSHTQAVRALGFAAGSLRLAEQVHGNSVALATPEGPAYTLDVDALITNSPGLVLGIHVADCGALYLADPVHHALGLAHSGKKGTELGIAQATIEAMNQHFGSRPTDLVAVLGPCIRPPHYEIDFASEIVSQLIQAGIPQRHIHDCGYNTAENLDLYYSYRVEKGLTGRHLALLGHMP